MANRVSPLQTKTSREIPLSQQAALDQLNSFPHCGVRSILCSMLDNSSVFLRRANQLATLPKVMGTRLLHIHVLTCLAGPNSHQCMPMVRRGNRDCVNSMIIEQFSYIPVCLWLEPQLPY